MDNVAINITSYDEFYKNRCEVPSGSVVDNKWHIRMHDGYERVVQGVGTTGDYNEIARVRGGRFADVVPSATKNVGTSTMLISHYCDVQYYTPSTGRCVSRAGSSGGLNYGLVFVNANNDSSVSSASYGSRLAFRGEIEFVE